MLRRGWSRRGVLAGGGALALSPATAWGDPPAQGRLETWADFPSAHVAARTVWIWTPPGYDASRRRFPVLYMHDGQNLFDASLAAFGEWGVDEAISGIIASGDSVGAVVVGISNTPLRRREYLPRGYMDAIAPQVRAGIDAAVEGPSLSDSYIRFLTEELKPAVDQAFRVRTDPAHTFVMGSSMGGLISMEALFHRPDVFGAAACLSTHWPLRFSAFESAEDIVAWQEEMLQAVGAYIGIHAPRAGRHRFWFDHGTLNLDRWYRPYQLAADAAFQMKGYRVGGDYRSRPYPGTDHNEASWRDRVSEPLRYLLRAEHEVGE